MHYIETNYLSLDHLEEFRCAFRANPKTEILTDNHGYFTVGFEDEEEIYFAAVRLPGGWVVVEDRREDS